MAFRDVAIAETTTVVFFKAEPADRAITNVGAAPAYLSDAAQQGATEGTRLPLGSSVVWAAGQLLWAIAGAPGTTLRIDENPGSASVSGGRDLATVYVGSQDVASGGTPASIPAQAVGIWPALAVNITHFAPLDASLESRAITLTWQDAAGNMIAVDTFAVGTGSAHNPAIKVSTATLETPVRGPLLAISMGAASTTNPTTITVALVGSPTTLSAAAYSQSTYLATGVAGAFTASGSGTSTQIFYPPTRSGPATLSVQGSGVTVDLQLLDSGKLATASSSTAIAVTLPRAPIQVILRTTGTSGSCALVF